MKLTLQTAKLKKYATAVRKTFRRGYFMFHINLLAWDKMIFLIYLLSPYISTRLYNCRSIHVQCIEERAGQSAQTTALQRRMVTLATMFSPCLCNDMMMTEEMRPYECGEKSKYKRCV